LSNYYFSSMMSRATAEGGSLERGVRRRAATLSGGVADDFNLGFYIDSTQDLIDPAEYLVLDQVLWAIPAL